MSLVFYIRQDEYDFKVVGSSYRIHDQRQFHHIEQSISDSQLSLLHSFKYLS